MLLVQQYLIDKVETLESLRERFGIFSKISEDAKLVKLDYDQIESAKRKDHPLVRECRGLCLEVGTWKIVAKSFNRFFNYKESADTECFDWNNFSSLEKVDGSLMQLAVYKDELRCFTRFSFANQPISDLIKQTWSELALNCLTAEQKTFIKSYPIYTFVFEFCSPYTQVVKFFKEPTMIMLGMFDNQTGEEVSINSEICKQAQVMFTWAARFNFKSIEEIEEYLDLLSKNKSTDEGFVLKDENGIRLKIKSKYYLTLHRLANNGNVSNIKTLIPVVLSGESDEIETYFPALVPYIEAIRNEIKKDIEELRCIYSNVIGKESQKDFALYLTKEKYTPFNSIFFSLRKEFGMFTFQQVEEAFMKLEDLILKVYKQRGVVELTENNI